MDSPLYCPHPHSIRTLPSHPNTTSTPPSLYLYSQVCVSGDRQLFGQPQVPVPPSQCGPPSGFEVKLKDGDWVPVNNVTLSTNKTQLFLQLPSPIGHADADQVATVTTLRYLFADWPTPVVYNSESFLGPNGQLPTPPFVLEIQ